MEKGVFTRHENIPSAFSVKDKFHPIRDSLFKSFNTFRKCDKDNKKYHELKQQV
jgi:hypothetical protein